MENHAILITVFYILLTTHFTILSVTLFLHRAQSHSSLEIGKPLSHLFRFWLWFATGQVTKEWVSIHRKHHAKCETEEDPHSPKIKGVWNILFKGVYYYRQEAKNAETLSKYGHKTPDDWLEKNLYTKYNFYGVLLLLALDITLSHLFLHNIVYGIIAYLLQVLWIPFWAAGVVNGVGHHKGYRNFETNDNSTNISPIGIIIGGEELHNNHHAYPTSAKFSIKKFEFDIGWQYIKLFSALKLLKIKKSAALPIIEKEKVEFCQNTVNVFLNHKGLIIKDFRKSISSVVRFEIEKLKSKLPEEYAYLSVHKLKKIYFEKEINLTQDKIEIKEKMLSLSFVLKKLSEYKQQLYTIWNDKHISNEEVLMKIKNVYQQFLNEKEEFKLEKLSQFFNRLQKYKPIVLNK